jgi:hypothetical protein
LENDLHYLELYDFGLIAISSTVREGQGRAVATDP